MGAWSHESFGNDDACDWVSQLVDSNDLTVVETTLDAVMNIGMDYLEAPQACEGIAAAEVVARLQGHFGQKDAYSESLDQWVSESKFKPSLSLAAKAHRALDRIISEPSELFELWHEGDEGTKWMGAVRDLRNRISV